MKFNSLLKMTFSCFLLGLVVYAIVHLTMNYSGFCWRQKRWLSKQEIIEAGIDYALKRENINVAITSPGGSITLIVLKGIPYKSRQEFLMLNPGCCSIVEKADEGFRPTFLQKLAGNGRAIVKVNYKFRYLDEVDGNQKVIQHILYPFISNCGIGRPI